MARVTHVVLVDGLPVRSWVEDDDRDRWDDRWDDRWEGRWRDEEPFPGPGATRYGAPRRPEPPGPAGDEVVWDVLCVEVGGEEALLALTDAPLPDEEVDWARVPQVVRWPVRQVLERVEHALARWPDPELRTACQRFVVDAAERHDLSFLGYDVARTAAAAFWAVGRAGFVIGPELRATNTEVLAHFGVRSSPEAHARRLRGAVASVGPGGFGRHTLPWGGPRSRPGQGFDLGDPRLLVSARRAVLVAERDRLAPLVTGLREAREAAARAAVEQDAVEEDAVEEDVAEQPEWEQPEWEQPEWERALGLLTGGGAVEDPGR